MSEDTKDCTRLPVVAYVHPLYLKPNALGFEASACRLAAAQVGLCLADDAQALLAELREELAHAEQWRDLALQFDRHRMNAMALIKAVAYGFAGAPECEAFAAVPPIPGHAITAELADLRAQLEQLQAAPAERGAVMDFGREKLNATPYFIDGKLKGFNIDAEEYARLSRSYGSLNPAPATADSDVREVKK